MAAGKDPWYLQQHWLRQKEKCNRRRNIDRRWSKIFQPTLLLITWSPVWVCVCTYSFLSRGWTQSLSWRTQWPGHSAGLTVSTVTDIASVPIGWPHTFVAEVTVCAWIWTYTDARTCSSGCERAMSISALSCLVNKAWSMWTVSLIVIQHDDN